MDPAGLHQWTLSGHGEDEPGRRLGPFTRPSGDPEPGSHVPVKAARVSGSTGSAFSRQLIELQNEVPDVNVGVLCLRRG